MVAMVSNTMHPPHPSPWEPRRHFAQAYCTRLPIGIVTLAHTPSVSVAWAPHPTPGRTFARRTPPPRTLRVPDPESRHGAGRSAPTWKKKSEFNFEDPLS